MSDKIQKNETKTVYANMHHLLTRAAVKWCYSDMKDVQVAVFQITNGAMNNSENLPSLDCYAKLNNIIECRYH
jgi:hypothetical protein